MKATWRKLWILPPALLVLVATLQLLLVHYKNFDRWEGGGFGMFASVDREALRSHRLFVQTDEGELPALLVDLEADRKRLVTLPNTRLLERELERIANKLWCLCETELHCLEAIDRTSFKQADVLKVLTSDAKTEQLPYPRYPKMLIEYGDSECESNNIPGVTGLRLELRRLVYNGDGRFSTRLLNGASRE
ncbi:hypothetical protein F7C95_07810 [Opitutia bacterium ISCC 51]|nr:hypothetical protein F7C95_07810 [Opitutae bacterium ISCC 51]